MAGSGFAGSVSLISVPVTSSGLSVADWSASRAVRLVGSGLASSVEGIGAVSVVPVCPLVLAVPVCRFRFPVFRFGSAAP